MNTTDPFHSPHKDILSQAIPVDSVSRIVFLNELKNRGKGAVGAGMWPDAVLLYKKAIEVVEATDDKSEQAILQSNLSLCLGKMHQWADAKTAASKATEADSAYVKGFWRLGQAHGQQEEYDLAVSAFKKALVLEPDNKALKKELDKFKRLQSEARSKPPAPQMSSSTPAPPPPVRAPAPAPVATSQSDAQPMEVETATGEFSKSDIVRGYKIVNGKKTSYFHNELSEDAKRLIGDIAPKKLESTESNVSEASSGPAGASAWNKAGTWEEKDVTLWAKSSLSDKLSNASATCSVGTASVKKATVDGSASAALARGKKRYIYELSLLIEWQIIDNGEIKALGKINFPDVDGTCIIGEPYEAEGFTVDAGATLSQSDCEQAVLKAGLRDALHTAIDEWVLLFKETY